MSGQPLRVLAVVGSLQAQSVTRVVVTEAMRLLEEQGAGVDLLDLRAAPLSAYNPDTSRSDPAYHAVQPRVAAADAFLLGTPDYHGSISGALKDFLDHFWHEFSGKLIATVVASHEKGLTVTDQLRTVARQCYAWTLPYGISCSEGAEVREGEIANEALRKRLRIFARDINVYGRLIASQRAADLACGDECFMARHRS
jgi:FMN reductase